MATKQDCIASAVRAGATPDEARRIVETMHAEAQQMKAQGRLSAMEKELARKIMDAGDADRLQAARERKQIALTIRRRAERDTDIARMIRDGASLGQALEALTVGASGRFAGSRASVSARRAGLRGLLYGGMVRDLDEIPGALDLLLRDRDFGGLVHREMLKPESTGDVTARKTAAVLTRYLEDGRVRANDAGANIGKLENYAPQSHAEERLLKAGRREWIDFVTARLNWERSFPGVTDLAAREELLSQIFDTITTGRDRQITAREKGLRTGPRNLGTSMSQERVLHFRDADASLEYHERFGKGNILAAVVGQLDRQTGKIALMEVFGPNPEAMIRSIIDGQSRAIRTADVDGIRSMARGRTAKRLEKLEFAIDAARRAGNEAEAQALAGQWEMRVSRLRADLSRRVDRLWKDTGRDGRIGAYYAVLNGETGSPVNPTAARIMSNIRGIQSMAKLGGAFLSAFADVFVKAVNLRHNGENLLGAWKHALDIRLEALQTHERKQFGRSLGLYANTVLGEIANRFDAPDAPSGAMTRATNFFFRLSGLNAWTEGHKAAYTMYLSNRLAEALQGDVRTVNADFAATLSRHGLDGRWALLRKMADRQADGELHLLPERAYALIDADLEPYMPERLRENARPVDPVKAEAWAYARTAEQDRIRRDTASSVMGFYADETRYAVLEPDEKTRAWMYGTSRGGTVGGEVRRFIAQFKSFPFAYMQRFLLETRWSKAGMERGLHDMPGMIHAVTAGLGFGYLAMCAKDLSKGRDLRSPDERGTWIAAALQSGGLGILGDFFLGITDRFGKQATANFLGPSLTTLADLITIGGQLVRGELENVRDDSVRLALYNTPYINLWYTRAALDYALLYSIRETLSPGTLARSERKLKQEYNQTYLNIGGLDLTPSRIIKRGGFR
jgi:hypothetical protein